MTHPTERLDVRFSDAGAQPTPWRKALERLAAAEVSWIVTVRPDGRPHATPLDVMFEDPAAHPEGETHS